MDSIGIAGFGYDFGSLREEHGIVEKAYDEISKVPNKGFDAMVTLLAAVIPILVRVPTKRQVRMMQVNKSLQSIADNLLRTNNTDKEAGEVGDTGRTIIGALSKSG